ncbi:MAG: hypothetical protein AAF722_21940, partial [Cyanobacteria bacterium P01_C01_bin.70]
MNVIAWEHLFHYQSSKCLIAVRKAQGYPNPLLLDQIDRLCKLYEWTFQQLLAACFPEAVDSVAEEPAEC